MIPYVLLPVGAYLLGAVPVGYLLVRILRGIDIRTVGSGNLGATNVARALGTPWFAVVFVLDFLKGFVPAFVIARVAVAHLDAKPEVALLYGLAAMAGHIWPIYLRFRGGKGVATASGAVVGIAPAAAGLAAVVFLVTLIAFRYVSLGSVVASVALPLAYVSVERREASRLTVVAFALIALLVLVKHRSNLRRILAGTESRLGRKAGKEVGGA
ncbi:MAG: glycerol-3-phosphate 1-O-acyltransferase PlsY [Planctomycetota bacterium]